MSIDLDAQGQMCFLRRVDWRTMITLPHGHRLITLYEAIPWHELMAKAKPILYDDQGISSNPGRVLNLRAHLGAYILQTVHGWTDRWTEEMIRYYVPARIFCGFQESTDSLDHTRIEAFRNRFGEQGARLITQDMLNVAKEYGFSQRASKGKDIGSTLRQRIPTFAQRDIFASTKQLCHRSWYVERGKYCPLPKRRNQKNCYSAKRKSGPSCQSTGPPTIQESSSGYRTSDRSFENTRAWSKSNENRYGRSYLRVPLRLILQSMPLDERFRRTKSKQKSYKLMKLNLGSRQQLT